MTKNKTTQLPKNSWRKILPHIKYSGENGAVNNYQSIDDFKFWSAVGVFCDDGSGGLTESGKALFETLYIRCDGVEKEILRDLLLQFPPTIAVQQYLWGLKNIKVSQVLTVLKTTSFWSGDSMEHLTHFLDLLNFVGVLSYSKKLQQVKILISPDALRVPPNVFIDPTLPFANIFWIKRILSECRGSILWFDKHFQKEALEWLWAIADANKIKDIKILSLDMGEVNLSSKTKKSYKLFKKEMNNKGINATWSVIDSKLVRDIHDRWVMDGGGYLRNLPNVNAILSGQRSEISTSENHSQVILAFEEYWSKSKEVI